MPVTSSTFSIPVSPLVQRVLAHEYDVRPFQVRAGGYHFNPFSVFLHAQLGRETYLDKRQLPRRYQQLTDSLTLSITSERYGVKLSPQAIYAFNTFVRQYFFRALIGEVKVRREMGQRVDQSIARILERYQIDEDILSFDTAQRYYRRAAVLAK